jgi:hypothetical protein
MFKRERHNLSRFWELFNPTTNNFQFWLASASFSFFAYSSLWEIEMTPQVLLAWGFQIFGWFCVVVIIYLLLSWIFKFRIDITSKKKEEHNGIKPKSK